MSQDPPAGPAGPEGAAVSSGPPVGPNLRRLLAPATLAVVGANEKLGMSNNAVVPMLEAGLAVHLVNPSRETLYDQLAHRTLSDVVAEHGPIDAVLALVNAERAVALVEEAAALGCGGVAVAAAGFGELGDEGRLLQARLVDAARSNGLAVIGPNCSGFKNVPLGVNLFTGGRLSLKPGGVSVVSQSGFLVRSALAAGAQRGLGIGIAISSGNEAVCDLADHLEALVDDEHTRVICLVIETIRRPAAFFAAVARARRAEKPVLALKLGRTDRSRRIMASHTGAIADASWVYELAFREHGVLSARDIDDLLDQAQLFAQLPPSLWKPIERIGVITTSGGVAALAADIAEDEQAPVPPLDELEAWVRERVPGDTVNPLDLTGFVMTRRDLTEELFDRYAEAVDLLVLAWWAAEGDEGWSTTLLEPFEAVAARSSTPFLVTPVEATAVGEWTGAVRERSGVAFARGVQSVYRAVRALNRYVGDPLREPVGEPVLEPTTPAAGPLGASTTPSTATPTTVAPQLTSAPPPVRLVDSEVGPIVGFADAMALLADVGIATAPHVVIAADARPADPPLAAALGALASLGGRLVVKLADVAHRTELGAVRVGVTPSELAATVDELRSIATGHGVPSTVVVQQMVQGHGEAFAGLQVHTDLGSVVLLGRGGVLVEIAGPVAGRLLPLTRLDAERLVEEVAGAAVFARLRGQRAWAAEPLVNAVLGVAELSRRHAGWLASVDLNPLIVTDTGVVAVDALMVGSVTSATRPWSPTSPTSPASPHEMSTGAPRGLAEPV